MVQPPMTGFMLGDGDGALVCLFVGFFVIGDGEGALVGLFIGCVIKRKRCVVDSRVSEAFETKFNQHSQYDIFELKLT